jgi:hypothetical protein
MISPEAVSVFSTSPVSTVPVLMRALSSVLESDLLKKKQKRQPYCQAADDQPSAVSGLLDILRCNFPIHVRLIGGFKWKKFMANTPSFIRNPCQLLTAMNQTFYSISKNKKPCDNARSV